MIDGINNNMGMMVMQAMQRHRGQPFSKIDSDGDGSINKTELEALSADISDKTGKILDTTNAFSSFDSNGDGKLNKEEFNNYMDDSGFKPPLPPFQQAMSAYDANYGNDKTPSILDLLDNQTENEDLYSS